MTVIKNGTSISLHYTATLEDGEVFDTTKFKDPISAVIGEGKILPAVEEQIIGMNKGETKIINLSEEQGYPIWDNLIVEVPKEKFEMHEFGYEVGSYVQTIVGDGKKLPGKIISIGQDSITIDCNHPLAGKKISFNVYILSDEEEEKAKVQKNKEKK